MQLYRALLVLVILVALSFCSVIDNPASAASPFAKITDNYAATGEPLKIKKLPGNSTTLSSSPTGSADVYIMVHPGYGVFFQSRPGETDGDAKYLLLNQQFENEIEFISSKAASGATMILVLPGQFETEGVAPRSFISYLNKTAGIGPALYYMTSKSTNSGNIVADDMINLATFLLGVKAERIMVGGGFIGRCQKEFFNELTSYLSKNIVYIVPEISTISPEDISAREASAILEGMRRQNYSLVKQFIDKKAKDSAANVLSIPPSSQL